jgi:hypothetical protein
MHLFVDVGSVPDTDWSSPLLHGPRKPMTEEAMLAILDEIDARRPGCRSDA